MNSSINSTNTALISKGEIIETAFRAIFFLLGICGNITVMVVLLRNFKRENFTLQLMLNLAVSDILCLAMLPMWIINLVLGWIVDLHWCPFLVFVTHIAIHASVFIVTLMSVQRYVVVLYRLQWFRIGRRGEHVALVFVWILAGAFAIIPAATYSVVQDGNKMKCEQVFRSEEQKVGVLLLETVLFFFMPFSILLVSYLCLHKKVSAKTMGSHPKLAILVTSIVVTFFIFFIPHHIVNIMIMATPLEEPVQSVRNIAYSRPRQVVQGIVYLNSCVNPLLYAFNYRSLRPETDFSRASTQLSGVAA